MARYGIINLEKLEQWKEYWAKTARQYNISAVQYLETDGTILSPEETEAKWKEAFVRGISIGYSIAKGGDEDFTIDWDQFKETL